MLTVLQKYIADSGFCSRRKAEELIRNGFVTVNGRPAELGMKVFETDEVKVKGKKIELAKAKIYIKLNKPVGYACTSTKVAGEKNVFDLVKIKERLFIVGRLDKNSRGLLLLTNDGELTQKVTHPSFEHEKKYSVSVIIKQQALVSKKELEKVLAKFKDGIDIGEGDGTVKAKSIRHVSAGKGRNPEIDSEKRFVFEITLTYGKKRQIRRMFKVLGFEVIDLQRTEIASLKLGGLSEGKWEHLKESEIEQLLKLK